MEQKKNEIEELIDNMISGGDDFVAHLKKSLPESLAETLTMFHESNVSNLKKIKKLMKTK
ncbi:MAG: hypothetical protein R3237_02240 [Nitrosopumilaceae archaeon]|nr:hypothetical protein [Nitrosopumilaceae archaeon]